MKGKLKKALVWLLTVTMILTFVPFGISALDTSIRLGETITFEVYEREPAYVEFVPPASGVYKFYGKANGGSGEFRLSVCDYEKMTIDSYDDYFGVNFYLSSYLVKGETYYWRLDYYWMEGDDITVSATVIRDKDDCPHENQEQVSAVDATCTVDGYTAGVFCRDCQSWISGHDLIYRNHTDMDCDEICDICGLKTKNVIASGDCGANGDNVKWTLHDNGEMVISGSGDMINYRYWYYNSIGDVPYTLADIRYLTVEEGVTSIGSNAFMLAKNLVDVNIADSVEKIGAQAFDSCVKLETVKLPQNLKNLGSSAFSGCTKLSGAVVIPGGVITLPSYAFSGCQNLSEVVLPDGLNRIGSYAFYGCFGLEKINLPDGLIKIDEHAFDNCRNLKNITIPDTVTHIEYQAFRRTGLTEITLPKSLLHLGTNAFLECHSIKKVVIPEGMKSFHSCKCNSCQNDSSSFIFVECVRLEEVVFPESFEVISGNMEYNGWGGSSNGLFNDCIRMKKVTVLNPDCEIDLYSEYIFPKTAVLCGYKGSTLEKYAEEWDYEFMPVDGEHIHNYESAVTKAATCTESGTMTYTCLCGDSYTEQIDAPGHKLTAWSEIEAATCTDHGVSVRFCTQCGMIENREIAPLGHTDADGDGACDTCGTVLNPAPGQPDIETGEENENTMTAWEKVAAWIQSFLDQIKQLLSLIFRK